MISPTDSERKSQSGVHSGAFILASAQALPSNKAYTRCNQCNDYTTKAFGYTINKVPDVTSRTAIMWPLEVLMNFGTGGKSKERLLAYSNSAILGVNYS